MAKIVEKAGIVARRLAADGETASDLGYCAAKKLLDRGIVELRDVDFLLFCTQSPDYFLPGSACILQHRLGLSKRTGALDVNLGCSGYIYGQLPRSFTHSESDREECAPHHCRHLC